MVRLTKVNKCGIAHNLKQSPFRFRIENIIYIFSSRMHLDKFKERYLPNRLLMNQKLEKRYGMAFNFKAFHDVVLYDKTETRGFLLENNANEFLIKEQLDVNGERIERK